MSVNYAVSLSFGAQMMAPGRVRFSLWAPSAQGVQLELSGEVSQDLLPLSGAQAGWFETETDCQPGTPYRYLVSLDQSDSDTPQVLAVPDPASRAQQDDVQGASLVVDPSAYVWRCPEWRGRPWHETVLYELHVGACGGFDGVQQKLQQLAALGITAIELMPIADFPGKNNWGYDGVLQFAPDRAYGTPEQLKALIDHAHTLGMMVFLDVVYNHFGPDGNYLGSYAAPFFRQDQETPWGQAIDFRQPPVREFFIENAMYWLMEYRFDGLRLDAVHAIGERDWLIELAERVRATVESGRHVHLVLENDANDAELLTGASAGGFDAQWNDDYHHALHVLLTDEDVGYYADYSDAPATRLARALAEGFIYQGDASPHRQDAGRGSPSAHLPPTAFVNFLQNHDQVGNRALGERLTVLSPPEALRAAMALLLLAPQVPMLFMGEEFGAQQPFLYFTSYPDPALADAVREGRRQEFAAFPAFADPEQRLRIPDPNAMSTFQSSVPQWFTAPKRARDHDYYQDPLCVPESWLRWTRTLLCLRQRHVMPHLPGTVSLGTVVLGAKAVAARWRLGNGNVLALAINLDAVPVAIGLEQLARPAGADLLLETPAALAQLDQGHLPGHAFLAWMEPAI